MVVEIRRDDDVCCGDVDSRCLMLLPVARATCVFAVSSFGRVVLHRGHLDA